jgi:ABC-type nitrate/sulfonate/bicarbonate transport system substrate-binding protein
MRLAQAGARVSAWRIAPAFLLVAVLVAGCHVPGTGGGGAVTGSGSITVAVVPGIDNAPLSVAEQDRLFQQHGLNVTVKNYPTLNAAYQALSSGQAQIAAGDYTDFIYEEAAGHPLQLIADGYDATTNSLAILTLPGSKVTTAVQLQSGTVAAPLAQIAPYSNAVPYDIETLAAEEVLQNDGVSPSSINWKPMSGQQMITALRNHSVTAILASEPYILEAQEQLGAVELVDASTGVTSGLPMSGYFSLVSYAKANSTNVQAFQAALDQAQADCAQRGTVQAVLPGLTGMTENQAALVTLGTYPASVNTGQVQRVAELMYDSGMISSLVNMNAHTSG